MAIEPFEHDIVPQEGILGWVERSNRGVWRAIVVVVTAAMLLLVAPLVQDLYAADPYTPVRVVNPMQIVTSEGVVPTLEGISGPAIVVTFNRCADENCTVVPIAYTQHNSTDEFIVVTASGSYYSDKYDRSCPTQVLDPASGVDAETSAPASIMIPVSPGESQLLFDSNVPGCVIEDIESLATEGIYESTWVITGTYEIPNAKDVSLFSILFTLVHPDSFLVV